MMIHEVKARYSNGTIVPLEPLDVEIEEGAALSISIAVESPANVQHAVIVGGRGCARMWS